MGYVLLNVIQGSDSVSGPYIRRGAHPPPHRHRPRVPTKLTHNHATGFPRRPCRGSLLGRPLPRYPASRPWLVSDVSVMLHVSYTCKSLVNSDVGYFFHHLRKKGGGTSRWGGVRKSSFIMICVCCWHTRRRARESRLDPGDNLTPKQRICILKVSGNARYKNSNALELISCR